MKKGKPSFRKYSIGVDIEEVGRFEKMAKGRDKKTLKKIFTAKEVEYCLSKPKPSQHLAARFAAKEAVIKALRGLGSKSYYSEIEITNQKSGVPFVKLMDKNLKKNLEVLVSLSHCMDKAIAFSIIRVKI